MLNQIYKLSDSLSVNTFTIYIKYRFEQTVDNYRECASAVFCQLNIWLVFHSRCIHYPEKQSSHFTHQSQGTRHQQATCVQEVMCNYTTSTWKRDPSLTGYLILVLKLCPVSITACSPFMSVVVMDVVWSGQLTAATTSPPLPDPHHRWCCSLDSADTWNWCCGHLCLRVMCHSFE